MLYQQSMAFIRGQVGWGIKQPALVKDVPDIWGLELDDL